MTQEVLTLAYELVDEIKSSDTYLAFKRVDRLVRESTEVQELSKTFKEAEEKYNDAKKYGKHHPDLKKRQKAFREAKKSLYEHPLVKKHKETERALQTMLDEIGDTLAKSVSTRLKYEATSGISLIGGSVCNPEKA